MKSLMYLIRPTPDSDAYLVVYCQHITSNESEDGGELGLRWPLDTNSDNKLSCSLWKSLDLTHRIRHIKQQSIQQLVNTQGLLQHQSETLATSVDSRLTSNDVALHVLKMCFCRGRELLTRAPTFLSD